LELLIVSILDPLYSRELYRFCAHKNDEADQCRYYKSKRCHVDLYILGSDFRKLISVNIHYVVGFGLSLFYYFTSYLDILSNHDFMYFVRRKNIISLS
jgi:hypothetical protein